MSIHDATLRLCGHGALLFVLGLVNGALASTCENTRMGLSAYLAGVQNGMVPLIFGLAWKHLRPAPRWSRLAEEASIAWMYAIWAALLLAAVFGTSRVTPIAGAGQAGEPWPEWLVAVLLYAGSAGILLASGLFFWGLRRTGRTAIA